eukprot:TRINITY_DN70894_c0_g1_i1.p1 TRINITY_DN70894_c0_g1~~TRINITY_DN70894_c0_g1_i1.p1  ORF type:complete len:196 (+),score=11.08 TRINITY_DN70894_c0_g1_i1:37-624(+)
MSFSASGSFRSGEGKPSKPNGTAWSRGWEASPTMTASPRWTFSKSLHNTPSHSATGKQAETPRWKTFKERETFLDEMLRAEEDQGTGEHLGPGSHTPLHVERVFQQPVTKIHGPKASPRRDCGSGGKFNTTPRPAVYRSLKQCPPTMLASCVHSPGPGSYTQFSSFGCPSGPTRTSYWPKATSPRTPRKNTTSTG